MIRPLCRMGHPILRMKAQDVTAAELKDPVFKELITDMVESMKHYGGVGLAAPQIGVSIQLAVIEVVMGQNRYNSESGLPLTVFVNSKIEVLDETNQGFWEGCLSVPGLRGYVERPRKLKISYQDESGKPQELIAEGFLATVIQHELDHLQGVLYIDRLKDTRLLSFQEEYAEFFGELPTIEDDVQP